MNGKAQEDCVANRETEAEGVHVIDPRSLQGGVQGGPSSGGGHAGHIF